jgi:hypothetical protein
VSIEKQLFLQKIVIPKEIPIFAQSLAVWTTSHLAVMRSDRKAEFEILNLKSQTYST